MQYGDVKLTGQVPTCGAGLLPAAWAGATALGAAGCGTALLGAGRAGAVGRDTDPAKWLFVIRVTFIQTLGGRVRLQHGAAFRLQLKRNYFIYIVPFLDSMMLYKSYKDPERSHGYDYFHEIRQVVPA